VRNFELRVKLQCEGYLKLSNQLSVTLSFAKRRVQNSVDFSNASTTTKAAAAAVKQRQRD
jgi:hypothetical protein